jgi:hypothetical protein
VSITPVPHSDYNLVNAVLFDKSPQRFAVAEQLGFVWVRLPIPTLYEAHEIEARARTEPGQQGLDLGRAGSASDYKDPALQCVVTDDPEEQRTRGRSEDE